MDQQPPQNKENQEEAEHSERTDIQVEFWTRQDVEHLLIKKDTESMSKRQGESPCEKPSGVSESSTVHFTEVLDGQYRPAQNNFNKSGMKCCHFVNYFHFIF